MQRYVKYKIFNVPHQFWLFLYDFNFSFRLSFQRLWTKYLAISENSARTQRVSLTHIRIVEHIFRIYMTDFFFLF